MASKEEEPHKTTTGSVAADRKRSRSPDANDISSATKKRSTDMHETSSSNQTTDDITTTTLSKVSNTNNDIPNNVMELFEEIDEKNTTQDTADSGQEIDIESFDTTTGIIETGVMIPSTANEQTETSAPEPTEPTEALSPKATESTESTESTSITTANEAKGHTSNEVNRPSDSLTTSTSIPIDKDTTTTSMGDGSVSASTTTLDTPPTAAQTSKKHHPGLTVPDKSSTVRQPFSDKFFFTNEAYEAYSHDSFMANIDSIAKKNKPGLALSLERPASSSSSRPPNMQPTHHHPQQQQQRSSYSQGATNATATKPSSATTDNSRNNNPPTTTNNNILDSLLDSISKNDRPVTKPAHVPSDIEIAMQAADLPSTQFQE